MYILLFNFFLLLGELSSSEFRFFLLRGVSFFFELQGGGGSNL